MSRHSLIFQILVVLGCMVHASNNIAVLDFTKGSGIEADQVAMITERLELEVVRAGHYTVLERRQIHNILAEQGFQGSGACDGTQCEVQVGQLLGVDRILTGSLGKIGSVWTMNAKLIDVQTGKILISQSVDIEGDLSKVLTKGCAQLAGQVHESVAVESEPKSNVKWWIIGGVTIATVVGVGAYIALQPEKPEPIDINRQIGLSVP